ncbi:alpha-galactosidase [Alistipes sp.]|uniref:alpha-galactosidase n=1 Tax=Alistipes sp. TaxID=1872444 RepID=UPI003AF0D009
MKKLLIPLLALLLPAAAAAGPEVIEVTTDRLSLVLGVGRDGEVLLHHFGGRIADPAPFKAWKSYRRADHGTDNRACPTRGGREFREPALAITHADGDLNTELSYVSHATKRLGDGVVETRVELADAKTATAVALVYTAYERENVITARSEIRNGGTQPLTLENFYSAALPVRASKYLLTHFYGAWAREMQVDHTLLTHGTKSISSRKGVRTTHTENPSFLLSLDTESFDENAGEVIAGALAWTGNFKLDFELDEFNTLHLLAGINPYASAYTLGAGERFTTPDLILTYSFEGAGGASRNLHDWARNHGVRSRGQACPTLLNSWEGAYFDFTTETLLRMIDRTREMGLEMFVLDDGWFGSEFPRNDSSAGLGDWEVNRAKLPEGIDFVARYAHEQGLKFGIWIEPEMVNERSALYREHPDWVVGAVGRDKPRMRNQWLLDLTNPAVQDFVFGVFDRTMQLSPRIDYIKWDCNRHVESVGSAYLPADRQSRFWIDYVAGFYRVMERIRAKYPHVLIQACSSGGGRVDYGALRYFDEVWTSDNTEALSRLFIQYGTNLIYPAAVTGAHVSAVPNHQTANTTPLKFRFDVASAGRLGMELQPQQMTEAERAFARRAVASYTEYRDLVFGGDLYRIASPYDPEGFCALMYVSKDKSRAVVFAYCIEYQGRTVKPQFRLRGLDPEKRYLLTELNVDRSKFWGHGETLGGDFLIEKGINPDLCKLYDSGVYYLEAR